MYLEDEMWSSLVKKSPFYRNMTILSCCCAFEAAFSEYTQIQNVPFRPTGFAVFICYSLIFCMFQGNYGRGSSEPRQVSELGSQSATARQVSDTSYEQNIHF